MNKKLIDKVVDKLIQSMMSAEIIKFKDSIWFIDRERHFWFFEFDTGPKHLWWRWSHFTSELKIFSINDDSENTKEIFVELFSKILNRKKFLESKYGVNLLTVSDVMNFSEPVSQVEEVLNCEVETTRRGEFKPRRKVEEALNCEVETTFFQSGAQSVLVEEVLNCEVETTGEYDCEEAGLVEEALNCEVKTTEERFQDTLTEVKEVLNYEVETTSCYRPFDLGEVEEILKHEVKTTGKGEGLQMIRLDEVLNQEVEMVSMKGGTECDLVEEALNYKDVIVKHGELIDEESFVNRVLEVLPDPSNNQARVDGILKNT